MGLRLLSHELGQCLDNEKIFQILVICLLFVYIKTVQKKPNIILGMVDI